MLRLEEIDHLRLVVPVPQSDADLIPEGGAVRFTVSAFPGRYFGGTISRISHALDHGTRTMPVEADVYQKQHLLDPGMFVEALWPVQSAATALFVPDAAVGGGQNPYVERVRNDEVERVAVTLGRTIGGLVEVIGNLEAGDLVVAQPTQELADGTRVSPHLQPSRNQR